MSTPDQALEAQIQAAGANPENFNAEIGRKIARENAVAQVWSLMGYELRSSLAVIEGLKA